MKVDKIIPCICCDHQPTEADSVYYGMPILKVTGGTLSNGKTVNFIASAQIRISRPEKVERNARKIEGEDG